MTGRVALLRAADDAERSAARLSALGFEYAVAPVLQAVALETKMPLGHFDAVLATSARGFELASAAVLASTRGLPLFVVGERAGEAARERRFTLNAPPSPDAMNLALLLNRRLAPGSRMLYLAGRDRKRDLEDALAASGHYVTALEVYEARAREAWNDEEIAALSRCDAALHYSRRSAELALTLARRAGLADFWRELVHVCISEDAAAPLREFGAARVYAAPLPREEELIGALAAVNAP